MKVHDYPKAKLMEDSNLHAVSSLVPQTAPNPLVTDGSILNFIPVQDENMIDPTVSAYAAHHQTLHPTSNRPYTSSRSSKFQNVNLHSHHTLDDEMHLPSDLDDEDFGEAGNTSGLEALLAASEVQRDGQGRITF